MREKILIKLAHCHTHYPYRMLLLAILLTLLFAGLSTRLSVTMRWSDLLPSRDPRTIEYNKIVEEFVSATSIIVVVQGQEDRIKAFAESLAPRLLAAKLNLETGPFSLIQRVDYKTEIDFLRDHGLMLLKKKDLENVKDIFKNPNLSGLLININNAFEKEYIGQEESISTREKEDRAVMFLDGIKNLISLLTKSAEGQTVTQTEAAQVADHLLFGESFFLSYDKKALILNAIPNFTVMDLDIAVHGTQVIQSIIDEELKKFPNVQGGLTGMIPICHDEMVYSSQSLGYTSFIAVIAILALLIISFRMWIAPLFAILNLLIGIVWAIGATVIIVGQLNIMTQMMAVILLGLGIDFSIHLISGFTEFRFSGKTIHSALENAFLKIGVGVVTGGLTTAFAFLALLISSSRGMKEMGLVMGTGVLAILFSAFLVLPIFLVLRERHLDKKAIQKKSPKVQRDISFRLLGQLTTWLGHHYLFTLVVTGLITILMIWLGSNVPFDQNYMNIEPEGITSVVLQDTVMDKFDLSMDYAMVLTDSPEESRNIAKRYRDKASVAMVEDISLYLPAPSEQTERIPHIQDIRKIMEAAPVQSKITADDLKTIKKEILRLRLNVIEMQDMAYLGGRDKVENNCNEIVGDPENSKSEDIILLLSKKLNDNFNDTDLDQFQRVFSPYFKASVLGMTSTLPIQFNDLPTSILDRYSNSSRSQFLVTVFPSQSIWTSSEFLERFIEDLNRVTEKATGMPPVFKALIDIIGRDGRNALLLTLIMVFFLLWIDFKNPKYALIAMVPLITGIIWMVGLMKLTGQQFTVMNVMGLPMILGIGIDDGVHVVHRWIAEGKRNLDIVFSSTGKAILLTSLTTMLGFGSLIFSVWRGFGHLGAALFVGVTGCFLTTVLILSGILGWIERKKQ